MCVALAQKLTAAKSRKTQSDLRKRRLCGCDGQWYTRCSSPARLRMCGLCRVCIDAAISIDPLEPFT